MKRWLVVGAFSILWIICAITVWHGLLDDVKKCQSKKELRDLIIIGIVGTICGPITAIFAGVVESVLNIVIPFMERWRELKEKEAKKQ